MAHASRVLEKRAVARGSLGAAGNPWAAAAHTVWLPYAFRLSVGMGHRVGPVSMGSLRLGLPVPLRRYTSARLFWSCVIARHASNVFFLKPALTCVSLLLAPHTVRAGTSKTLGP